MLYFFFKESDMCNGKVMFFLIFCIPEEIDEMIDILDVCTDQEILTGGNFWGNWDKSEQFRAICAIAGAETIPNHLKWHIIPRVIVYHK